MNSGEPVTLNKWYLALYNNVLSEFKIRHTPATCGMYLILIVYQAPKMKAARVCSLYRFAYLNTDHRKECAEQEWDFGIQRLTSG